MAASWRRKTASAKLTWRFVSSFGARCRGIFRNCRVIAELECWCGATISQSVVDLQREKKQRLFPVVNESTRLVCIHVLDSLSLSSLLSSGTLLHWRANCKSIRHLFFLVALEFSKRSYGQVILLTVSHKEYYHIISKAKKPVAGCCHRQRKIQRSRWCWVRTNKQLH